jgi:prepilin-type N-terminal cleavage/methylation domain-containing protein
MKSPVNYFAAKGFTLIEVLVSLVILSLTISMLVSGISITLSNFEKLNSRDLTHNKAKIGLTWLYQSIHDAQQYHPHYAAFYGEQTELTFITSRLPNQVKGHTGAIKWLINADSSTDKTYLKAQLQETTLNELLELSNAARFEYLVNQTWQFEFKPQNAQLPTAVRLVDGETLIMFAAVRKPGLADEPPELTLFGEYEFGPNDSR